MVLLIHLIMEILTVIMDADVIMMIMEIVIIVDAIDILFLLEQV